MMCRGFLQSASGEVSSLRLPTEAQWEYACRAGSGASRYMDLDAVAWHRSNSGGRTHRVGRKAPNAWGLHDMLGHLWEWCHDYYGSYGSDAVIDPMGPHTGTGRVLRGGCWGNDAQGVRAASRGANVPSNRSPRVGFRLSRDHSALQHAAPGGRLGARPGPRGTSGQGAEPGRRSRPSESGSGIVLITDRRKVQLDVFERPDWASHVGRDRFGLFAEVEVQAVKAAVIPARFRMRWIPPGRFMMGSPKSEEGPIHDDMGHQVTLSEGYWLSEMPCTQALWWAVTGANPSRFKGAEHPVEQVSWEDVQAFLQSVSVQVPGLRLPTEAQWEYACRAGSEASRYGDLDAVAWHRGNSDGQTQSVGQKAPNAWGLYDMLGNIWEWCHDYYGFYSRDAVMDPVGRHTGTLRVVRGGSWRSHTHHVRAVSRHSVVPVDRDAIFGFRLSRDHRLLEQAGPGGRFGARATSEDK